jgi:SAM-dependent methyltransferase
VDPRFSARYADFERWHWWFRGRERILETVLRRELARAPAGRARRIVALGCGPPAGLAWLVPLAGVGGLVVGLDADPSGALRERTPDAAMPRAVSLVLGRMESPPLRPRSFDAAVALDVLEHLDDDASGLRAAADLVRPGGLVLVTVPALPSLWGAQDVVSHHRRRYTRRVLAETFERAGIGLAWESYFNAFLFPPIAAVRWLRRLSGRTNGAKSDFEMARPGPINELLHLVFSAERHVVGRTRLPIGVSLLAVARIGRRAD